MGQLNLQILTGRDDQTLKAAFETPGNITKYSIANKLINFITSLTTGSELAAGSSAPSIAIAVHGQATPASGTFTFSSIANTNTLSINGVTFTCVTSGATGNQFNVGASDTEAAANAAAAINASATALIAGYVTATSALGVVTITSVQRSITGNQTTITGGTHVTASGARLTGGAADPTATTISF